MITKRYIHTKHIHTHAYDLCYNHSKVIPKHFDRPIVSYSNQQTFYIRRS
jgi:hypothetical protein